MEKVPCVVQGEASESESEQDEPISQTMTKSTKTRDNHGALVPGEAPESDEEHTNKPGTSSNPAIIPALRPQPRVWNSLLHKKLGECNTSLHSNIMELVRVTVNTSLVQLNSAEQQLLKSQIKLQQASTALRSLDATSNLLGEKLERATHTPYIPKIHIPNFQTKDRV